MIRIGVTPSGAEGRKLMINQDYLEAVYRAGAVPVLFPLTGDGRETAELLSRVDGLLLTGGEDVDPALYGEEKRPCCGGISEARDAMEIPLCRLAVQRDLPLLAICRGLQVLACALGGTLYQDIAEEFSPALAHVRNDRPLDPVHEVSVSAGSGLLAVTGRRTLSVNSRHHQAVRLPGKGMIVTAKAPDGTVEAAELPGNRFALGVQWHPEALSSRYPEHQALFDALVRAAGDGRQAGTI